MREWTKKGQIINIVAPRSYTIRIDNGNIRRRNQRHIRKVHNIIARGKELEQHEEDITIPVGSDNDTDSDSTILHNEENNTDSNSSVPYMVPTHGYMVITDKLEMRLTMMIYRTSNRDFNDLLIFVFLVPPMVKKTQGKMLGLCLSLTSRLIYHYASMFTYDGPKICCQALLLEIQHIQTTSKLKTLSQWLFVRTIWQDFVKLMILLRGNIKYLKNTYKGVHILVNFWLLLGKLTFTETAVF